MSGIFLLLVVISSLSINQVEGVLVDPMITCVIAPGTTAPCSVDEDAGQVIITVVVTQDNPAAPTTAEVALQIFTENDDTPVGPTVAAMAGTDYISINTGLIPPTVAAATLTYSIPITIIDNNLPDGDRSFLIDATHLYQDGLNPVECTTCAFRVTIVDDDILPTVYLDSIVYHVNEGSDAIVSVTADGGTAMTAPVAVELSAMDLSATNGEDYTVDPDPISIPGIAADGTGMTMIPTSVDGTDEGGFEVFKISINTNAAYNIGEPSTAWVFIKDVAAATAPGTGTGTGTGTVTSPTYWIEYSDYKASESQSPFTFNIKRSATGTVATITFSTRDVSTTAESDYDTVNGATVTFAADSDTAEANVNIKLDRSTEDPEVFEISIASPNPGDLGPITKATVTLYDALSLQSKFYFDSYLYPVMESKSEIVIKVRRDGDVSKEGSVVLVSSDVDALSTVDYQIINTRITFEPDEVEKTHRVLIESDTILEPTELFQVTLTQAIGGVITSPGTATISIKDDDYCFSLASRYYSSPESSDPLEIGIVKSGYLGDSTSVNFDTSGGTADENDDYTGVTLSLDFARDVATMTVPGLTLIQDGEYERQEQFTIAISASDTSRVCEPSTATVIIENRDGLCNPECNNNGICTGPNTCLCPSGFTGDICDQTECTIPCENNGICTGPNTCVCPSGYDGPNCAQVVCPASYCVNGGTCVTTDASYLCQCTDGFEGIQCDKNEARPGLSDGAIAGIAIGSVAGILIIAAVTVCFCLMVQQRSPLNAAPNQIPLNKFQPPNQPFQGLNPGILIDGESITYPYQHQLGVF